jgi:cell wall-associated NlpC family hydrolase
MNKGTEHTSAEAARNRVGGLDARRHAYRPDIADVRLKGQVDAARFVSGAPARVAEPVVALRRHPAPTAPRDTEALFGERVHVFDRQAGWAWLQLERDGYVGYLPEATITHADCSPTHRLCVPAAIVYAEPSALAEPVRNLPLNATVAIVGSQKGFAELDDGGFVGERFLAPCGQAFEPDHAATAERFLGVPYLFGGRSAIGGIDCSGLVQMALAAAGIAAPRDSDMQQAEVGQPITVGADFAGLARGDLVFWPDHVAIMVSSTEVVHASATNMCVAREPLTVVADRSCKGGPRLGMARRIDDQ